MTPNQSSQFYVVDAPAEMTTSGTDISHRDCGMWFTSWTQVSKSILWFSLSTNMDCFQADRAVSLISQRARLPKWCWISQDPWTSVPGWARGCSLGCAIQRWIWSLVELFCKNWMPDLAWMYMWVSPTKVLLWNLELTQVSNCELVLIEY